MFKTSKSCLYIQDQSEEISSSLATHSRGRQMDGTKLDAKIVKALKKQEEKREKRTLRKKEVLRESRNKSVTKFDALKYFLS
jgi:hypothetical protein